MLRFAQKPDLVFSEILKNAFELIIDEITIDISLNGEIGAVFNYFDEKLVKSFGGFPAGLPIILNELKKLNTAHLSSDLYMPTDIHFKMIDGMLQTYCYLYNDQFHFDEKLAIKCNGETVQKLSYTGIIDTFFWDKDYDFEPRTAFGLLKDRKLRDDIDITISTPALNAAAGMPVDFSDLKMEKWEDEEDWDEEEDLSDFWMDREEFEEFD